VVILAYNKQITTKIDELLIPSEELLIPSDTNRNNTRKIASTRTHNYFEKKIKQKP
jgi:hypothetical protein